MLHFEEVNMSQQPSAQQPRSAWEGGVGCKPLREGGSNPNRPPRRFAVQPVETSSRSSEGKPAESGPQGSVGDSVTRETGGQSDPTPARRRFLPEPIETTHASNRGAPAREPSRISSAGPRRFKPEVIETDHESVPGRSLEISHQIQADRSSSALRVDSHRSPSLSLPESKFSYASLLRRQETRRHSFRVPELPSIPSNSSEDSGESSRSPSRSVSPTKAPSKPKRDADAESVARETHKSKLSEYLLSLAARSAQKELKEQALAAFPNEQDYEPVDHFAIDDEEGDSEVQSLSYSPKPFVKSRRRSSADLSWELEYMRQHKEEAEQRLRAMAVSGKPGIRATARPSTPQNPRHSPPMLGDDIVLPWSTSPEGTLCEHPRAEGGSQAQPDSCNGCDGLWGATSRPNGGGGAGLWMGTCRKDEDCERDSHTASGMLTPMALDQDEEMRSGPEQSGPWNHPVGTRQPSFQTAGLLGPSKTVEEEFHDGFVTQIYNYLSLGYPCMARYYDHELSQVSGVTVEELRRDDLQTDAKGHLITPEKDLAAACTRWKALRLYIQDWARQQPNILEDESGFEAWGVPERRGSWAG